MRAALFAKFIGASGLVTITAPFPWFELVEEPYLFVAKTFAKMLDPHGKLNGDALSVEVIMEQDKPSTTYWLDPLQSELVVNVTPSLVRMLIVYAVITDPWLDGATH